MREGELDEATDSMHPPEKKQAHENVKFGSLGSCDEQCRFVDRIPIIQARPKFPDPGNNIMDARKNVGENGGNLDSSEIDSYLEGGQSSIRHDRYESRCLHRHPRLVAMTCYQGHLQSFEAPGL